MQQEFPLADLRQDPSCQSRADVSHEAIEEYERVYRDNPDTMPAIRVWLVSGIPYVVDGFHRTNAAKSAGITMLACEIVGSGEMRGAILWAAAANRENGVRRTRADVRKAIRMALEASPEWSDRSIAHHIGCDHKTVGAEREATVGNSPPLHAPTRIGLDGVSQPARKPKQEAAHRPEKAREPAKVPAPVQPIAAPPVEPEPPLPEPPKTAEVDEYADHIRLLRSRMQRALKSVHISTSLDFLAKAEQATRAAAPMECPTCSGKATGCRSCGARGWVRRGDLAMLARGAK